jgi:hypothetical protein
MLLAGDDHVDHDGRVDLEDENFGRYSLQCGLGKSWKEANTSMRKVDQAHPGHREVEAGHAGDLLVL